MLNLLDHMPTCADEKTRCSARAAVDLRVTQTFGMRFQAAEQKRADSLGSVNWQNVARSCPRKEMGVRLEGLLLE